MHIIKDENGNVCPHGHEHGHAHTHDGVCQEGCSGCESHDPKKENIALLAYMLQHNEHHAAELDQMAEIAESRNGYSGGTDTESG